MTIKAVRIINQSDVIVVPGKQAEDSVAYRIAAGICENLTEKQLIAVEMPMVKDDVVLEAGHRAAAEQIEALLEDGLTVSFLTLGDVTVYATYMYVHKLVAADGYETEIINGITSFTAAAARLNTDLVEKDQPLHVIPASYRKDSVPELLALPGTKILMKAGKEMKAVRAAILASGQEAVMVGWREKKFMRIRRRSRTMRLTIPSSLSKKSRRNKHENHSFCRGRQRRC